MYPNSRHTHTVLELSSFREHFCHPFHAYQIIQIGKMPSISDPGGFRQVFRRTIYPIPIPYMDPSPFWEATYNHEFPQPNSQGFVKKSPKTSKCPNAWLIPSFAHVSQNWKIPLLLGWSFRSIRLRSWDPSGGCCSSWVGENRSKGPTGWNSTDKDFTGGSQQSLQVRLGNIIIYIYMIERPLGTILFRLILIIFRAFWIIERI